MSKASDLFERIAKKCPYDAGSGKWMHWISEEMKKTEDLEGKLLTHARKVEDENRRHAAAMKELKGTLATIQKYCPHEEMVRGIAEDDEPACMLCGWYETEYRRS